MLRAVLPLLLLPPALAQRPAWRQAELPRGFQLDLASGEVADAGAGPALRWEEGRLEADAALRALEPRAEGPAALVRRWTGAPVETLTAQRGDELVFDLGADGWGYLRVLAAREELVRLEWARAPAAGDTLARDPHSLRVRAGRDAVVLDWDATPGGVYRVERRVVGDAAGYRPLARVAGDRLLDPTPPDGLLEYRVLRADHPDGFGISRRTVRAVLSEEEPLELARGMQVDLLSGGAGSAGADLEVLHLTAQAVSLRPLDGTLLYPVPQSGVVPWTLPPVDGARYVDQARTVPLDAVVAAHLREDVYARLIIERVQGGGVQLRRQVEPEGGRVLPVAPRGAHLDWRDGRVSVTLDLLGPQVPRAESLRVVLEVERGFHSGAWDELAVGEPGSRALDAALLRTPGAAPIVRLRLRHRLAGGPTSAPSGPEVLLLGDSADADQVEVWLEGAFDDLLHADFERRLAARGVIVRLGRAAAPRLERALRSSDPELAAAAREILVAAAAADGGHVELLLRARAIGEGVDGPAPAGLFDPDSGRRAWALMRAVDSAAIDPARGWGRVIALADPDDGVAQLARLLAQTPPASRVDSGPGAPFVLLPPDQRPATRHFDWRGLEAEVAPSEAVRQARAAVDLARPDTAALLLRTAAEIELPDGAPRRWRDRPGLAERVELALRLTQRAGTGERELLAAAGHLLESRAAAALAARTLLVDRLRSPRAAGAERRRVEVRGGFDELAGAVASLAAEGATHVDLALGPGEYVAPAGDPWLDLSVPGLRLIGAPGVRLMCGLRVADLADVVLEDLTVENSAGSALVLTRGSATAVRCRFAGVQTTLMVNQGTLDLDLVECVPADERRAGWCLRLLGGQVSARACLFAGGTVAGGSEGAMVLDHCVIDAGVRTALQGQRGDEVLLFDCLVRSDGQGVVGVERGLGLGVVFDTLREPIAQGAGFQVCPDQHARTERTPALAPQAVLRTAVFKR